MRSARLCLMMVGATIAVSIGVATTAEAGSAFIGGKRMSCYAANVVLNDKLPGPGFAVDGELWFNPKYLRNYPPVVQRFIFMHECGHQYVGIDETAADCWAVARGKQQGWLTEQGVALACKAIWNTASDGAHLDGPVRCEALKQCFLTAPGKNAKASSQ
jgi:hypothetical protein